MLTNGCGRDLDFSDAELQFSDSKPKTAPWGERPAEFDWMDWQPTAHGFSFHKSPSQYLRLKLHDGSPLQFIFITDTEPKNPKLYLGKGSVPAPPVVVVQNPPVIVPPVNPPPLPLPSPAPLPQPAPLPLPAPVPSQPIPSPMPVPTPNPTQSPEQSPANQELVVHYELMAAAAAPDAKAMSLAKLPAYVTTVLLSYVRPDLKYVAGANAWGQSGAESPNDFATVRDAVKILKEKNPNTKVLLTVGGPFYVNWRYNNPVSIAAMVKDLGADGVALDYEPSAANCKWDATTKACETDLQLTDLIRNVRAAMPKPLLVTTCAWHTGAFGTDAYPVSKFAKALVSPNFGLYVNPLKEIGTDLDAIYIQSFNAGGVASPGGNPTAFDPRMTFDAYRALYKGPLMIGVAVPPEVWGDHVTTVQEAQDLATYAAGKGGQGTLLMSVHKGPAASTFAQGLCQTLKLSACSEAMPTN